MEKTQTLGLCQELVSRRRSIGIMGKGTESWTTYLGWCKRNALAGGHLCKTHQTKTDKIDAALAARKAS